jgi:hypothetical protein
MPFIDRCRFTFKNEQGISSSLSLFPFSLSIYQVATELENLRGGDVGAAARIADAAAMVQAALDVDAEGMEIEEVSCRDGCCYVYVRVCMRVCCVRLHTHIQTRAHAYTSLFD